ncbi:MAG: hypothetical protein JOZ81_28725 [Chloroflexi bacterium]|nr:hypothetical protein [Chloroflexota bacterium]
MTSVRVRLVPGSHYLPVGVAVVGKTVTRPLAAGELIPQAALDDTTPATTVTVPLATTNAPKISRGQRIELWVTTRACSAVRILDSVPVQDVQMAAGGAFATGSTQSVTVRLAPEHAQRLITALALDGAVVRAGILDGPSPSDANRHLPSLDACAVKR